MSEAIRNLRESFYAAQNAGQERCYGLLTNSYQAKWNRQYCDVFYRNYCTGDMGLLATVYEYDLIDTCRELVDELQRLRETRTMQRAA